MMANFQFSTPTKIFLSIFLLPLFTTVGLTQPRDKFEPLQWKNPFQPDAVDKAIETGMKFLLKNQKADGAIYDRGNPIAITALSLMSLAAVGHLPIHPNEKGEAMAKALDFILLKKNQNEMGYFGKDGGRMYGHGIVTLTLAEMLGMGMDQKTDKLIREKCQKAIDLIVRSQKVKKNQFQQLKIFLA